MMEQRPFDIQIWFRIDHREEDAITYANLMELLRPGSSAVPLA
jgi:hypothetical protein